MVHGAVLSLAISDEGQSIDKKANCSTFIYTRKRRTPQSLFCDCISSMVYRKLLYATRKME